MKNRFVCSLLLLVLLTPFSFSQDKVAMIIDDREISLGEFERLYRKNNSSLASEKQDLEEYIERFINFKLKVIEAENMGMDTTQSFIEEFNSYRKELAKPYMVDSRAIEESLRKEYNKLIHEVNASHILLMLDENASPEDTLEVWGKLMEIRDRSISGEDFGVLAKQYSDDPNAESNNGNLGYFGAYSMVPEFADMAYLTQPGDISIPVRTAYGYHIIKVHDKRPSRGSVKIAHIYISLPYGSSQGEAMKAQARTFEIYEKLKAGEDFGELAMQYSDDKTSANNGGEMEPFPAGIMIPAIDSTAFSLQKPGELAEPVQSSFGWHIIKLLEKKLPGTFEEERDELLNRLKSQPMTEEKQNAYIEKLKNDHNLRYNQDLLKSMYNYVDTSFYSRNWSPERIPNNQRVLLQIGSTDYSLKDFGEYLQANPKSPHGTNLQAFVNQQFKEFSNSKVYEYEESLLPGRHPEFKHILREYHDGILLFELTDKKVWSKAVNDTAGLEAFFKKNRKNYNWGTRAEAYIVTVHNPAILDEARRLTALSANKSNFSEEFLDNELCREDTIYQCIELVHGKFEKGSNELIDQVTWKKGLKENVELLDGSVSFVFIRKVLRPGHKELDDARGLVISDYQEYLEKEWIKELRGKYRVSVNHDVISSIN